MPKFCILKTRPDWAKWMLDSDLGGIFDKEKPKKVTGTIFTQIIIIIDC